MAASASTLGGDSGGEIREVDETLEEGDKDLSGLETFFDLIVVVVNGDVGRLLLGLDEEEVGEFFHPDCKLSGISILTSCIVEESCFAAGEGCRCGRGREPARR